jgi:NADH-quinone oxidoreductase subunit M
MLVLAALALAVLVFGIYPYPMAEVLHATVENLLAHVAAGKAN